MLASHDERTLPSDIPPEAPNLICKVLWVMRCTAWSVEFQATSEGGKRDMAVQQACIPWPDFRAEFLLSYSCDTGRLYYACHLRCVCTPKVAPVAERFVARESKYTRPYFARICLVQWFALWNLSVVIDGIYLLACCDAAFDLFSRMTPVACLSA